MPDDVERKCSSKEGDVQVRRKTKLRQMSDPEQGLATVNPKAPLQPPKGGREGRGEEGLP